MSSSGDILLLSDANWLIGTILDKLNKTNSAESSPGASHFAFLVS